jgi:hypothetical protein
VVFCELTVLLQVHLDSLLVVVGMLVSYSQWWIAWEKEEELAGVTLQTTVQRLKHAVRFGK